METITWHWTGFKFHPECLPNESELMAAAKKDLGAKPEKVSDEMWLLVLQNQQRQVMTECFLQYADSGNCCGCMQKAKKAEEKVSEAA